MVQPSEREKCAGPRRDGVLGVAGASKDGGALDWSRRSDEPGAGAATEGTPLLRSVPPIQPGGGSESNRRNVSLAGIVAAAARSSARARLGFFVAAVAVGALAVAAFLSPDGVMTPINGALDVVSMTQGSGSWLWGSSRRRDHHHHHHHRRHHDSKSASVSACERIRHALLEIEEERHEHYEERDHHARDHHYDSERHGRDKKKEEEEVKPKFHGRILFSDSRKDARKFDASVKVWNERYNSQKGRALNPPCASVIPCSEQDDTDMVVPLLVQHGANIVIKSGGHCYADYSSASSSSGVEPSPSSETSPKVLLDLSQLNSLDFDFDDSDHPDTVLAILGPGTTMGQILQNQEGLHDALMDTRAHSNHHDRNHVRLAEYYYAGVLGSGSQVAAGGYILGGGYGYWSRRHGLAIDNLVEAHVVLANGTTVVANANQHADLFWALRGAGQATFGVVTRYTYRLYRAHRNVVVATAFELPPHELIPLLVAAAGQGTSSSYPLDCHLEVMSNPKGAELDVACLGATERDLDTVQHQVKEYLRKTAPHHVSSKLEYNRTSWIAMAQAETDSFEGIMVQYWNGLLMPTNNNVQTWKVLIDALFGLSRNNPHILVDIELRGGAIAQVDSAATAFPWRNAAYVVGIGVMVSPAERHADAIFRKEVKRVNEVWDLDVSPHLEGMFPNYAMESLRDASAQEVADLAWGDNAARLEQIKALYDPTNAFHSALSIVPAPAVSSLDEAHDEEPQVEEEDATSAPTAGPSFPAASLPPTSQPTSEAAPPTDEPSSGPSPNPAVPAPPAAPLSETFFPTYDRVHVGVDADATVSPTPIPAAVTDYASPTAPPSPPLETDTSRPPSPPLDGTTAAPVSG